MKNTRYKAGLRRRLTAAGATITAAALLAGCSVVDRFFGEDAAEPGPQSNAVTAKEDAGFELGAVQAWKMAYPEPFTEPNPTIPLDMALSFGPVTVLSSYGEMVGVDAGTGYVLWTIDGVGPLSSCAIDDINQLVYCPTYDDQSHGSEVLAVDPADGEATSFEIKGANVPIETWMVEEQEDTLVLFQRGAVTRTDMNGRVLWQQVVEDMGTENVFFQTGPTTILVSEPASSFDTVLDLETGAVLYSGDSSSSPQSDVRGGGRPGRANVQDYSWANDARFEDAKDCLFEVEGALLFAPNNCYTDDTAGVITAYDPQSGEELWQLDAEGTVLGTTSGEALVIAQGMQQVGLRGALTYESITTYRPAEHGEPTDSIPATGSQTVDASTSAPDGIPDCPASTVTLSWAQIPNGWALVCGYSESEPTVWISQFDGATEVTSHEVSETIVGGSPGYRATLPSGSQVEIGFDSPDMRVIHNAGEILSSTGSAASSLPILVIYFVNMGVKEVADAGTLVLDPQDGSTSAGSSPVASGNAPTGPAPSSAYCPAGTTPHFEGETEGFFISICKGPSGYTYVGYSPTAGEMVLPAESQSVRWWATNQSHGYSVSEDALNVYELAGNKNILSQPFIWTRQY